MDKHLRLPILNLMRERTPVNLSPKATVAEAIRAMKTHDIGAIPVVVEGRLVGIFTERDYVVKIASIGGDAELIHLGDVMVPDPVCVQVDDPIGRAILLMADGRFRHIGVTDPAARFVDILSVKDVMRFIADAFELPISLVGRIESLAS